MRTYTLHCLSEALSPITHNSGTAGNESMIAREPVHTDRGVMYVPFLSGNALRHRTIREPMAKWLISAYELQGKLSKEQLNFLLHGGNLTMSTAMENTQRIAEMHRLWPLLRLCGGALPDQILSGSLDVWRGTLVCEENRQVCESVLRSLGDREVLDLGPLVPAERYLSGYQYTRGDAGKTGLAADRDDLVDSNLMIYSGQAVTRGAKFLHGYVLKHVSEVHLGCLLFALRLWRFAGGTIGGNARLGHGRIALELIAAQDDQAAVDAYIQHVWDNRAEAVAWLEDAFVRKAKPRKGAKSDA